jgi:hypothetical protein
VIAGDIIFYSGTKTRSDDPDFKDFAHLAGYVQSYPYGDASKLGIMLPSPCPRPRPSVFPKQQKEWPTGQQQ